MCDCLVVCNGVMSVPALMSFYSLIQRWSFSRVFEGISSWSFTDSAAVCAHLASCPILHAFAKSYDPTTPWKLSGLGQSLHKKPETSSHQKSPSYGGSGLFSETSSEDELQLQD